MIDIQCYRTNYAKTWKNKGNGYTIPAFPCNGAVDAIHALCDEVERLRRFEVAYHGTAGRARQTMDDLMALYDQRSRQGGEGGVNREISQ